MSNGEISSEFKLHIYETLTRWLIFCPIEMINTINIALVTLIYFIEYTSFLIVSILSAK